MRSAQLWTSLDPSFLLVQLLEDVTLLPSHTGCCVPACLNEPTMACAMNHTSLWTSVRSVCWVFSQAASLPASSVGVGFPTLTPDATDFGAAPKVSMQARHDT